jgi:hypothetical protein
MTRGNQRELARAKAAAREEKNKPKGACLRVAVQHKRMRSEAGTKSAVAIRAHL